MSRTEFMTSRERVNKAIRLEKTDRMPIDCGVHFSTGISAFAYYNLRKYLGLDTNNIEVADCTQFLARIDDDIIERFHVDTVILNPRWEKTDKWNPRGEYMFNVPAGFDAVMQSDGSHLRQGERDGVKFKTMMPAGGFFFEGDWVGAGAYAESYARRAERIYKETDKFTMMMGFSAFFPGLDFACDMLTDPDDCKNQLQETYDNQVERFDKVNAEMGKYIGAIEINGDLGMQSGLMCTPDSYRDVCYPFLKKFCEHVHNTSEIKLFMHACGSVIDAMDYVTDAKVDILNPVQISAAGMDPNILKEKYGKKICFWGGCCDTQVVLWSKTPKEVVEHVRNNVRILGKGGGLVFNQVHNVMGNVPPENIIAMFDTAWETAFDL